MCFLEEFLIHAPVAATTTPTQTDKDYVSKKDYFWSKIDIYDSNLRALCVKLIVQSFDFL